MSQQSNCGIGHSRSSHSQTLFNSVNFPNGTIVQMQSSLARFSAVVKGCLIDQYVLDLYIPLPCPLCHSQSNHRRCINREGYKLTAKAEALPIALFVRLCLLLLYWVWKCLLCQLWHECAVLTLPYKQLSLSSGFILVSHELPRQILLPGSFEIIMFTCSFLWVIYRCRVHFGFKADFYFCFWKDWFF